MTPERLTPILCESLLSGAVAQLGERHAGSVEVTGPSPVGSTGREITQRPFGRSHSPVLHGPPTTTLPAWSTAEQTSPWPKVCGPGRV